MKNIFYDTECLENYFAAHFLIDDVFHDFVFHNDIDNKTLDGLKEFYTKHNKAGDCFIGFNSPNYDELVLQKLFVSPGITLHGLRDYSDDIIRTPKALWYSKFKPHTTKKFADVSTLTEMRASLKKHAARIKFPTILESRMQLNTRINVTENDVKELIKYSHNDVLITKTLYESDECQGNLAARLRLSELFNIKESRALCNTKASLAEKIMLETLGKEEGGCVIGKPRTDYLGVDVIDPRIEYETQAFTDALSEIKSWKRQPPVASSYDSDEEEILEEGEAERHTDAKGEHNVIITIGGRDAKVGLGGIHYGKKDNPINFTGDKDNYILDVDVNSHYPTILANNNFGPEGIEKLFAKNVLSFITLRDEAKAKGDAAGADVFKLASNSLTGKLKQTASPLYCPMASDRMVLFGQLTLLQLMEKFHLAGFVMAQANTDGLSVIIKEEQRKIFDEILNAWNKKWNFAVKAKKYMRWIQNDMNNYLAVDESGKIKAKGLFKSYPDNSACKEYPIVIKAAVDFLLRATPVSETIRSGKPLEYTKYVHRDAWVMAKNKEEVEASGTLDIGFNERGVNRFYLVTGVENELRGFYVNKKTLRKSTRVEGNCAPGNDVSDIKLENIDHERYAEKAEKIIKSFEAIVYPDYSGNTSSKHSDNSIKGKGRKLKKTDVDLYKILKEGDQISGNVLNNCPDCGSSSACKMQDIGTSKQHTYCFSCNTTRRLSYFINEDSMNDEEKVEDGIAVYTPPEPQKCPTEEFVLPPGEYDPSKIDWLDINNLPECVWAGVIGKVADAVGEKSWKVLNGALSARHAVIGRKISAKYRKGKIYGNIFTMTTGHSGSGKSLVPDIHYISLGKEHRILPSVESGQALFHAVSRSEEIETGVSAVNKKGKSEKEIKTVYYPVPVVLVFEEFMASLKKSGYENSTLDQEICLLFQCNKPYGNCSQRNLKEKGVAVISVDEPEVSIVGTLITEQFRSHFNTDRQMSGFLNRFLLFPEDKTKWEQFDEGDFDESKLSAVFDELKKKKNKIEGAVAKRSYLTDKAKLVYDRCFNQLLLPIGESKEASNIPYIRLQLYFYIIALGYAYDASRYDCIDEDDALAAEAIIWSSRKALLKLLDPSEAPMNVPQFAIFEGGIYDRTLNYIKNNPGKTKRCICKALKRANLKHSVIGKAIKELIDEDLVRVEQGKPGLEEGEHLVDVHFVK